MRAGLTGLEPLRHSLDWIGGHGDQTSQLGRQLPGSAAHPWELVRRLSLGASVPSGVTRGHVAASRGVFDRQWTLQGPELSGQAHPGGAAAISDSDGTSTFICSHCQKAAGAFQRHSHSSR